MRSRTTCSEGITANCQARRTRTSIRRRRLSSVWKDFPYRFVFSHEASYCPWFELPSGAAVCYQFFEGNLGWAELFNNWGRQERNSFVDVLEPGPQRVWVRWTYFGVNMEQGQPAYRGTEDFWAFPNGLIVRRQTFETLLPGDHHGYAREPFELIGLCPVGRRWCDVLRQVPGAEDRHALAVLDVFSDKRYDVFGHRWPAQSGIPRIGGPVVPGRNSTIRRASSCRFR